MSIGENLHKVRERIAAACAAAGRSADSVRLVAVSKFQPVSAIEAAYQAGQRDFGENYVQELEGKASELAALTELRFHLIGHLQRNKVKKVAALSAAIHSVDSSELIEELGKRVAAARDDRVAHFGEAGAQLDVLLEVSIAREAQKAGCAPEALPRLLDAVDAEPALRLRGLMCVPPQADDPAPHFQALFQLRESLGGARRLPELSMGMTADLEAAIAAGTTCVRVGTAIFGERPPKTT
ncbi:MAG: YggS family pyridoxal phosphate-dependent enzyme [Polyangiaceae bacterium]